MVYAEGCQEFLTLDFLALLAVFAKDAKDAKNSFYRHPLAQLKEACDARC